MPDLLRRLMHAHPPHCRRLFLLLPVGYSCLMHAHDINAKTLHMSLELCQQLTILHVLVQVMIKTPFPSRL